MPDQDSPSLAEWRALCQAALRVKDLAPWQWLLEHQVFGVKNPETGGLGFVSIMGNLGEHLGVSVYLGARGLYNFMLIQAGAGPMPQLLLETAQLMASYEDREMLEDHDRQILQRARIKVRGRQSWPMFRSHRPAFVPWYVDADEARFLTLALEQVLEVAPRLKAKPDLLPDATRKRFLVRVSEKQDDGSLAWRDREQYVQPPGGLNLQLAAPNDMLEHVAALPKKLHVEVHVFMLLEPAQDKPSTRPYFPYMLMVVDRKSGMVVGSAMLKPVPQWKDVWEDVPFHFLKIFGGQQAGPQTVDVMDSNLAQILGLFAEDVGYRVRLRPSLPALQAAQTALMRFMLGGISPDLPLF